MRTLSLIVAGAAWAGCGSLLDGSDCAPVGHFALDIRIEDALTHAPISGATIIVSGAVSDTAVAATDHYLFGDSSGSYSVRVSEPGYEDFTKTGIVVRRHGCGEIQTASVVASLTPNH